MAAMTTYLTLPTCLICGHAIMGSAKVAGRSLAHPSCFEEVDAAVHRRMGVCSVCNLDTAPDDLDQSARCGDCTT